MIRRPERMTSWLRRLIVFASTVALSVAAFEILLLLNPPGWKSQEHVAITIWSLPLGVLVLGASGVLRRLVGRRSRIVQALALPIAAAIVAVAWTFAAIALTGGYALAFDANPLWCWFVGALTGLGAALFGAKHAPAPTSGVAAT